MQIYRSKAPLRLGLAGGGTDVSPYCDIYGGAILNSTINMYAHTTLEINGCDHKRGLSLSIEAVDRGEKFDCILESIEMVPLDGSLSLHKGVFNYLLTNYNSIVIDALENVTSLKIITTVDAPAGSGLGTSSTLMTSILGAFCEWLQLPLGEYDIAHMAYQIERTYLGMAGGQQDQYAATFGGVNFMEFYHDDKVIVNPLRIKTEYLEELEHNLILYYTGTSRLSSKIIESQVEHVKLKNGKSIDAMHKLKDQAVLMKEALLKGQIDKMGELLDLGWTNKKQIAQGISNPLIDEIYETAKNAGATGGKITGAGGGGFMMFYCPKSSKYSVISQLIKYGGELKKYQFAQNGLMTWTVKTE